MIVGKYTAGAPKQLGKFVATAGVPHKEVMIDHGALYASKGKATHALAGIASWLCPLPTPWTIILVHHRQHFWKSHAQRPIKENSPTCCVI